MVRKIKNKENVLDSPSSDKVNYEELKRLYEKLKEYMRVIEKNKRNIPLCVFSFKLSGLETIVKYLKENLKLEFKEISILLGRSVKTIWQAYNNSRSKLPKPLAAEDFSRVIPVSLFKDRRLSILEHIVFHLKNEGMRFSDIGRKLERDPRTIWTVYSRAKKKNGK